MTATDVIKIMFYQWYKRRPYGRSDMEPYACAHMKMLEAQELPDSTWKSLLDTISQEQQAGLKPMDDAMQRIIESGFVDIVIEIYKQDSKNIIRVLTTKLERMSMAHDGKYLNKNKLDKITEQIAGDAVDYFMIPMARPEPMSLYDSTIKAFAKSLHGKKSAWEKAGLFMDLKLSILYNANNASWCCKAYMNKQSFEHPALNTETNLYSRQPGNPYLQWTESFLDSLFAITP